ncbi:MAG TPA: preprotein translocase subunit SecE [Dehalococcoidia bacterium]
MSRALRRHPVVSKPQKQRTPKAMPRGGGRPPQRPRTGWARFRPRWVDDVVSELRKVTWPTREEATNLTIVVVVVSIAVGLVLGGIDLGFSWIIEQTILR